MRLEPILAQTLRVKLWSNWASGVDLRIRLDRRESSGAERAMQEAIRHLSALVNDERVVTSWAQPEHTSSVRLLCNSTPLSERGGYSAHDLQFGAHDQPRFTQGYVKSKKSWSGIVKKTHQSMAAALYAHANQDDSDSLQVDDVRSSERQLRLVQSLALAN